MSAVNPEARASAAGKKAIDYEMPKDAEDTRSASEVQRDIERVREELTATVDELAARFTPEQLKADLKASAKSSVEQGKAKVQALASDAKAGDKKAIGIIAGVVGAVALVAIAAARK